MTEVDRDIGLALLKLLRKRELISEETYVSCCNSRFFDEKSFTSYAESTDSISPKEGSTYDEH